MGPTMNVCAISKDGSTIHKTTAIAVVVLYVFVASTIDLFHTDKCQLAPTDATNTDVIFNAVPCPACTFLAGHSSTGASFGLALVVAQFLLISQFSPRVTVVLHNEWGHSIVSLGPPSETIS